MSICKKSAIFKRKRPQKIRNKFEKQLEHKKNHIKPQKPSFFIHAKYIEEKSYLNFKFMNNVGYIEKRRFVYAEEKIKPLILEINMKSAMIKRL